MRFRSLCAGVCSFLAAVMMAATPEARADTRVEVLATVQFNGFRFGFCSGDQPCPWVDVRPGQRLLLSFIVDDTPVVNGTFPCPNPIYVPQTFGYPIRNGTLNVRVGDVALQGIVSSGGGINQTVPALRVDFQNCVVDVLSFNDAGALLTRAGRCCFPSGACTFVRQADCPGAWTQTGACTPTNTCPQPAGRCCAADGGCTIVPASECVDPATWSFGGACDPGACPQDVGACCNLATGECFIGASSSCLGAFTSGLTCAGVSCAAPVPGFEYALSEFIIRAPTGMLTSANLVDNRRFYPGTLFDPNRGLGFLFSRIGPAGGPEVFELFSYPSAMNISDDATPTGACCPGDGTCLVATQAICPSATWTSGAACAPGACPSAAGACCLPDGTCQFLTPAACGEIANALYTGNSTTCTTAGVCPPTGGCCVGGACSVLIQSACQAASGFWMGAGTSCLNSPQFAVNLTTTAGACCDSITGACVVVFQGSCNIGTWLAGTSCNPHPCVVNSPGGPLPVGACCNIGSGACTIVEQGFCTRNNGIFNGSSVCDIVACPGTGSCCNPTTAGCSVVFETACTGVWTVGGTCNNPCPTAGACCNALTGFCSVVNATTCASGAFTPGAVCSAPCAGVGTQVPQPTTTVPAPAPLVSTLSVAGPGTVESVEVWLNVETTRVIDIRATITSPSGRTLELFRRPGAKAPFCTTTPVGPGVGYSQVIGQLVFTDSAPTDIFSAVSAGNIFGGGRFRPAGCGGSPVVLNAPAPAGFGGLPLAGTWTLTIADDAQNVPITIRSWGLSFNGGKPEPCTLGACTAAGPGGACTQTTFVQCAGGAWTLGACTPGACPTGTVGACCYQTGCSVVCASQCPPDAVFLGSGSACSPGACLVACCLETGACSLTTRVACSGTAQAAGSVCSPNTCTQPGSCCGPNGSCSIALASRCTGTAGAPGSTCSPNPCLGSPAPINDRCIDVAGAASVQPFDVILTDPVAGVWNSLTAGAPSSLLNATPDGVAIACDAQQSAQDVWYRFAPAVTGLHTVSLCSTPSAQRFDSTISIFSACAQPVEGLCADDTCASGNSGVLGHATLQTNLISGRVYLIRVGAYRPGTTGQGPFTLTVTAQTALGACCFSNGNCALRTAANCTVTSGTPPTFFGVGTTCVPGACTTRTCCRGTTCARIPAAACVAPVVGPVVGVRTLDATSTTCDGTSAQAAGCCFADFNKFSGVTIDDIFIYLNAWFASSPFAKINGDGIATPTIDDIFIFLNAWFAGCV